jgi:lipid A 3-O-deacylase
MIRRYRGLLAGLAFICCIIHPGIAHSQDSLIKTVPATLVISGGIYSCLDLWATTGFVNFQYQPGIRLWILRPHIGVLGSLSGSFMFYTGLTWPAKPFKWLLIQTGAAFGYYESGNGIRMGSPFEFRISLSVLYEFRNSFQLGLEAAHFSNANFSADNPGTESIGVIFQVPLGNERKNTQ